MSNGMLQTIAWGFVNPDGTLITGRGAASARIGVGEYELTLSEDRQLDVGEMMMTLTPSSEDSVSAQANTENSSDLVKGVLTFRGGVANDVFFFFKIEALNVL